LVAEARDLPPMTIHHQDMTAQRERHQRQVVGDRMGAVVTIWQLMLVLPVGRLVGDGIGAMIGSSQLQPLHRLKLSVHHQQLAGHGALHQPAIGCHRKDPVNLAERQRGDPCSSKPVHPGSLAPARDRTRRSKRPSPGRGDPNYN